MPVAVRSAPSPAHTPASAPRLNTPLRRARAVKGWTTAQAVAAITQTATGWGWQLSDPVSLRRQLRRWESGTAGLPDMSYRALLAHVYGTTEVALGLVSVSRLSTPLWRARAAKGWTTAQAVAAITQTATGWGWQLCGPTSLRRQLRRWESGTAGRPDASYRALLAHVYGTTEVALGLVSAPSGGVR